MKFGVSLAHTMPLPSSSLPKRLGARLGLGRGLGAGDELEQLHVARRVEEVRDHEVLLELLGRGPTSMSAIRRPDVFDATIACGAASFSSFSNSACLMSSRSTIASMMRSQSATLREVVLEVADRDQDRVARVR